MQEELENVIDQNHDLLRRNRELEDSCTSLEKLLIDARSSKSRWAGEKIDASSHPKGTLPQ